MSYAFSTEYSVSVVFNTITITSFTLYKMCNPKSGKVVQDAFLNPIQNAEMLHDLEILGLAQVQLIRVLTRLERVHSSGRIHRRHLLGHLVGSYSVSTSTRYTGHPVPVNEPGR